MTKENNNSRENGSMASNMEEVKQLGKQMEKLRDERKLNQDERVADPSQHDHAPETEKRED